MPTTKRLIVNPDGSTVVETVTTAPAPAGRRLLGSVADTLCLRLPRLAPDLDLVLSGSRVSMFRRILHLRLNCPWKTVEEGTGRSKKTFMHPEFAEPRDRDEASEALPKFRWRVPEDMALYFIGNELPSGGPAISAGEPVRRAPRRSEPPCRFALLAFEPGTTNIWRLPLPNTYDNGGLCTGQLDYTAGFPLIAGQDIYGSWEFSQWNTDLIERTEHRYRRLVRLDPLTGETLPVEDWRPLCFRTSLPEWLPRQVAAAALAGTVEL